MYNTYKDGTEKLVGRYCGMTAPGPIESNRGATGVKIILHSDQEGVFSGFKARYTFESVKSIFGGNNSLSLYVCVYVCGFRSMSATNALFLATFFKFCLKSLLTDG
jgi:hypothetical protein